MIDHEGPKRRLNDAIGGVLDDGEIAISWVLIVDVAGQNNNRYLAHRAGGGVDGDEIPMAWTALGMLEAGVAVTKAQVFATTYDADDPEDDDDGS